jgi:acyl-CoA thioesterase
MKEPLMPEVKLNFRNLSIPEKIAKARQVLRAITGNAKFPNPVPPLTALTDGTDALDEAYVQAQRSKQAWRSAVDVQNKAEDALDQLVSRYASYVESVAGDDESIIAEAPAWIRNPRQVRRQCSTRQVALTRASAITRAKSISAGIRSRTLRVI